MKSVLKCSNLKCIKAQIKAVCYYGDFKKPIEIDESEFRTNEQGIIRYVLPYVII